MNEDQVGAVDLGSSTVRVAIARRNGMDAPLTLQGWSEAPSAGVMHGEVVDLADARDCLHAAIVEAEKTAGEAMTRAWVGFSGGDLRTAPGSLVRSLGRSRPVEEEDRQQLLQQSRQTQVPQDRQVLHALVNSWFLDERIRVQDPIGLQAASLGLECLIASGDSNAIGNLRLCLSAMHCNVEELVFSALAVRRAVLTPEEEEMGVAVLDFGGGTTNLMVVQHGRVRLLHTLGFGGGSLTREMATLMHCPWKEAERVKLAFGAALPAPEPKETIRARTFGDQSEVTFSRRFLTEILTSRLQKAWDELEDTLRQSGLRRTLTAGIVLVGGASRLAMLPDSCRSQFRVPVRLAEASADSILENPPESLDLAGHGVLLGLLSRGSQSAPRRRRAQILQVRPDSAPPHPLRRWFGRFLPGAAD